MSDLKLLPPDQPTPLEQRLLDAVANEAPSAEQRQRVRLALGLPALAVSTAPAPVPVAPVGRRALLLKLGGGLVIVSAAMVALFFGMGRTSNADKAPTVPLVTQPIASAAPPVVTAAPATPEPAPSAAPPTREESAPPTREESAPSKRASRAVAAESGADLSEQLRLIDAARSAVAAGNASAASAALSTYRTRFPRGPFGQEAAVLQIQTLDLQGNHAQAAAQARSFLARHPNSPHVSVVQRIANR